MQQGRRPGGPLPPQILEDQIAPPAAAARRLSTGPPRFLDFAASLQYIQTLSIHLKGSYMHKPIKYILYIDLVF